MLKPKKYLSELELKKINKNLNELEKTLLFKKFNGNIDCVYYENLDNYDDDNFSYADDDVYRKIGSIRKLFKKFDIDNYKPIIPDRDFDGKENN